MNMMTFQEWLAIREGLWLNDDKAVERLSELPQPKPKKPHQHKPLKQAVRQAKQHVGSMFPKPMATPMKNGRP